MGRQERHYARLSFSRERGDRHWRVEQIGRELANQLADQGAWLSLSARDADRLEAVAAECQKRGGKALVVSADESVQADCQNLIARTIEAYGRIDTLVNNAGIGMLAKFAAVKDPSSTGSCR